MQLKQEEKAVLLIILQLLLIYSNTSSLKLEYMNLVLKI